MLDKLSEYEKQRLANIAGNQDVLRALGLVGGPKLIDKPEKKPKKKKVKRESAEPLQPTRVLPKRGKETVTSYDFSHHYDELDRLEREEKKRVRDTGRPIKPVSRYSDEDFNLPTKRRPKRARDDVDPILFVETGKTKCLRCEPLPYSEEQKKKLFSFNFTSQHLIHASFPSTEVKAFQSYCDDRAHIRFPNLTINYDEKDITSIAHAITRSDDLSAFDSYLVSEYRTALAHFKASGYELAPYNANNYSSVNPKVICPGSCASPFALKDDGNIRHHGHCTLAKM